MNRRGQGVEGRGGCYRFRTSLDTTGSPRRRSGAAAAVAGARLGTSARRIGIGRM